MSRHQNFSQKYRFPPNKILVKNRPKNVIFKTLIPATGSASVSIDLPVITSNAKFTMRAPQTGESADVELSADISNWDNFHLRAYADQYFNILPLVSIYAADITGNFVNRKNPKLVFAVTRDDSYTEEVETYDTILECNIGENLGENLEIPASVVLRVTVPDFIFGPVPYNDNSVGYHIDVPNQSGDFFLSLIPTSNPNHKIAANLKLGLTIKPSILINIDFGYSFGGDDFIANQAITLHDNGVSIGQKGHSWKIFFCRFIF